MSQTANIAAILRTQAQTTPDVLAIASPQQSITFAELDRATCQAAMLLHQSGLKSGDTALIFQPMSVDLYVALLAIFRLGMVAMFVDPSAGQRHLEQCCGICPPQVLIASSKAHLLRIKSSALRQIPLKFAIGFPVPGSRRWSFTHHQPYSTFLPCPPETPALITFTSGSTGQPKAALRTHGFLLAQHQVLSATMQLPPGSMDLTTLPIFVLANLASGVTSLIPDADLRFPGKINAAKVMRQIQAHQPQSTAASPAFLERLAGYCEQKSSQLGFQKIFSGGAPVFPDLLERLQKLAPGAEVTAVYGSTEAEPIAHIAFAEMNESDRTSTLNGKGLLAGIPVTAIDLRIVPDQWGKPIGEMTGAELEAMTLSNGEVGEIVVSGDHVLPGYLAGRGNAETKFRVEEQPWHRTGDAGYFDAQGRLWLLGRCSARIEDEWGVVYPLAIEAAAKIGGVRRSAIVMVEGRRVLVVELERGASESDVLAALRESLGWAKIGEFRVCRIPVDRRHNAKVDYPELYEVLGMNERRLK
jgi:olefin beta-lactone synthetase